MDKLTQIRNYKGYLIFIEAKLSKFFNSQKPYIFCKRGCGKCCQNAHFPYSQLEFDYLMLGYSALDFATRQIVDENISKTLKLKHASSEEKFRYDCPFLINNECSVYPFRGIICRAFGLMTNHENDSTRAPFCAFEGLNYSNVIDPETKIVSMEKFKTLGVKEEPLGFNVSYKFLTNKDFEEGFQIQFGEAKSLIEWFEPKTIQ